MMEEKYGWKNVRLGNETYYFDGKNFAQEVDHCYLTDVKDPKIISELEKKVGLNKLEKVAASMEYVLSK